MNQELAGEMYLLDNNALSHLSREQRASDFFRRRCRLPAEVIHEASGYPDAHAFAEVEYPTTARVLEHLRVVMSSVPHDDTSLVDLYANKGAGDPMLVACALDAIAGTSIQLFGPTWVIVSNDKAVRTKAADLEVESCSREDFAVRTRGEWEARPQTPR